MREGGGRRGGEGRGLLLLWQAMRAHARFSCSSATACSRSSSSGNASQPMGALVADASTAARTGAWQASARDRRRITP